MNKRAANGFTLLEITITLAIIAVVFTVASSGFNRTNSGANLTLQAETMISDIRATALMAINSEQFQLQSPASWGVYLDTTSNTYTIFADLDGDSLFDLNEKYKAVTLSKNIIMGPVYFNSAGWPSPSLTFGLSTGTPFIDANQITNATGPLEIQIKDNITNVQKSVWVNSLGAVSL